MRRAPAPTVEELRAMERNAPKLSRAEHERREKLREQFIEERRPLRQFMAFMEANGVTFDLRDVQEVRAGVKPEHAKRRRK